MKLKVSGCIFRKFEFCTQLEAKPGILVEFNSLQNGPEQNYMTVFLQNILNICS